MKKLVRSLMVFVAAFMLVACGSNQTEGEGGKIVLLKGQFSEITIIQEMAKILIENNTNLDVEFHDAMNTVAASKALAAKEVDLYVSYDGTLLATILQNDPSNAPEGQTVFEFANELGKEEKGLFLLDKFGFENTYALAVKEETAEKYNLKTISDLAKVSNKLVFGAEHEFFDEEGSVRFGPLNKAYNFDWKDSKSIDMNLKYSAIDSGSVDVIMAYSTDGLNKKSNLVILEDDKKFFPEYNTGFLLRADMFEEFKDAAPNLEEVLNKLTGQITTEEMIEMNFKVDAENQSPADVAKEFLDSKNIK